MSTLKTTNLQHPSAGVPAIVLDAAGDATYAGVHDFSAATVTGAPQGLVHINTTTFSAVSSVSLNNVFTSEFDFYKIILSGVGTNETGGNLRLRTAGTDASGSNYNYQSFTNYGTGSNSATASTTSFYSWLISGNTLFAEVEVLGPYLAAHTRASVVTGRETASSFAVGYHNLATSYDGFTFIMNAGTLSGTIRVYGYRNEA